MLIRWLYAIASRRKDCRNQVWDQYIEQSIVWGVGGASDVVICDDCLLWRGARTTPASG